MCTSLTYLVLFLFFFLLLLTSPLIICLSLVIISMLVSGIFFIQSSKWMCYSMILIFLGGMMVVFLYVSMISLDCKITLKYKSSPLILMPFLLSLMYFKNLKLNHVLAFPTEMTLSEFYTIQSLPLTQLMVFYLLMSLFAVVFLAQSFKGSFLKPW